MSFSFQITRGTSFSPVSLNIFLCAGLFLSHPMLDFPGPFLGLVGDILHSLEWDIPLHIHPNNLEGLHNSCSHSGSAPGMTSSQHGLPAMYTQLDSKSAICYLRILFQCRVLTPIGTSLEFSPTQPVFYGGTFPEFHRPFFCERQVARQ